MEAKISASEVAALLPPGDRRMKGATKRAAMASLVLALTGCTEGPMATEPPPRSCVLVMRVEVDPVATPADTVVSAECRPIVGEGGR